MRAARRSARAPPLATLRGGAAPGGGGGGGDGGGDGGGGPIGPAPAGPFPATLDLADAEARRRAGVTVFEDVARDSDAQLGYDVEALGDVDGDGVNDASILSGERFFDGRVNFRPFQRIVYGGAPTLGGTDPARTVRFGPDTTPAGTATIADVGRFAGLGDVDGDGLADAGALVGERVEILYGPLLPRSEFVTFGAVSSSIRTGIERGDSPSARIPALQVIAPAGDLDADGLADVIVSEPYADSSLAGQAGRAFVVYGAADRNALPASLDALDGTNGFAVEGIRAFDFAGLRLAPVGDFDADGFDDVAIAAGGRGWVLGGGPRTRGASIQLHALDGSRGFGFEGLPYEQSATFAFGIDSAPVIGAAGDLNADGFDDLAIGYPFANVGRAEENGVVGVLFGRPFDDRRTVRLDALAPDEGFFAEGAAGDVTRPADQFLFLGDETGRAVASPGDIDGDGVDDLAIGAPAANGTNGDTARFGGRERRATGAVWLVYGRAAGFPPVVSLAAPGDVRVTAVLGESVNVCTFLCQTGFAGRDRIDVGEPGTAGDSFGFALAATGDVTGDGRPDLLIGAPTARDPAVQEYEQAGRAYVLPGR